MGSMFGSSKPSVDPELEKARKEEAERLKLEKEADEREAERKDRMRRANLLGQQSLQSKDIVGFGGFKQLSTTKSKTMGTKSTGLLKVD